MDKNNMRIWEMVEKTNPSDTKHINVRGGFTAIAAQSQIKRATEIFGPIGLGWGFKDEKITIVDGGVIYQAVLWYTDNDNKGQFPIASSFSVTKSADIDDGIKKASTDAITKGLSRLGFNSDVFEGKFDDSKYVNERKKDSAAETAMEGHKNKTLASQRAAEMDAANKKAMNRGEIHTKISELEAKAHINPDGSFNMIECDNSRLKHLNTKSLEDVDDQWKPNDSEGSAIKILRAYGKHLQAKIKGHKDAVSK